MLTESTSIALKCRSPHRSQTYTADHRYDSRAWDEAGFMKPSVVPSGSASGVAGTNEYGYDATQRRIFKKIDREFDETITTVEHTVYVHAGPNLIAQYAAGAAAASPGNEYVYAGSVGGPEIDSLVLLVRSTGGGSGNERLTITRNQQWSVTALSDSSTGNVVERYTYDHFGNRTILEPNGTTVRSTSSYNMPFGYTSRQHDFETGLMYFRARYYDPHTAEFTSPDPLEYVDGMSLFRGYMDCNMVDPFGSRVVVANDPKSEIDLDDVQSEIKRSCKDRRDPQKPWKWGSTSRTFPEALNWICETKQLSPDACKSTVNLGCIGVTSTLIGKNIMFPRDYQNCFDTLIQAKSFKDSLDPQDFCSDNKNSCGEPSKPVIFGFTWNRTLAKQRRIDYCTKEGLPIPKWGEYCQDCGMMCWNGETPIRSWPWDFGYYMEDRGIICHASTSAVTPDGKNGVVKFSLPVTYECYEGGGVETIYCVTCEGDGKEFK